MEYWNLYDYEGKKQNKIAIRGSKLNDSDFHLVVNAWIVNDKNEFLITQRVATKSHPLMWECTGGSALINEKPIDAAIREIKEELGLTVDKKSGILIGTTRRYYKNCPDILSVWLFKSNASLKDVTIQEEEVNDVMWASREKIMELFNQGKFEANALFDKVINYGIESNMDYKEQINNSVNDEFILKIKDKNYIKELLKENINFIDTIYIDRQMRYDQVKEVVDSTIFVLQGKENSNTFYIDNEEKFKKYSEFNNHQYFVSKYIKHLPIRTTIIVNDYNDVYLPTFVSLIHLLDDQFKWVGADFIYYQNLSNEIKEKVNEKNKYIVNCLKQIGYKGILEIDYILDEEDTIYFMNINPQFHSSSCIFNKNLEKYCSTTIEELHCFAITNKYIGNTYLDKMDISFLHCYDKEDYSTFKYAKIIKNDACQSNKQTYFKIYQYSLLKHSDFEKRQKDC